MLVQQRVAMQRLALQPTWLTQRRRMRVVIDGMQLCWQSDRELVHGDALALQARRLQRLSSSCDDVCMGLSMTLRFVQSSGHRHGHHCRRQWHLISGSEWC